MISLVFFAEFRATSHTFTVTRRSDTPLPSNPQGIYLNFSKFRLFQFLFLGPKSRSNVLPSIVPRPLLEDKFSPLINRCSCFANSDTVMTPGFKNYFEAVLIEPFANKAQSCLSKGSQLPIIRKTPRMNSARPKEKKPVQILYSSSTVHSQMS